ncbi:hypothetical protein HYV80_03575 [Candidatus Woesearchaeota archaeon]|nr:hypothetical protein [Candidatus Woesearchaeota archaeon]
MNYSSVNAVRYVTEREREFIEKLGRIETRRQIIPDKEINYASKYLHISDFARVKGLFAFISDETCKWKNHEYFVNMWHTFLKFVYRTGKEGRVIALHFEARPEDGFQVLDWGPVEWDLTCSGAVFPETWSKYLASRVPLKSYRGDYELPELVTMKPIAKSRITLEDAIIID